MLAALDNPNKNNKRYLKKEAFFNLGCYLYLINNFLLLSLNINYNLFNRLYFKSFFLYMETPGLEPGLSH